MPVGIGISPFPLCPVRGPRGSLEFVSGDAFHGVCKPTIRSLSSGELRAMDGEFLRYSLEIAIRGWCRWMRIPTSIVSGGAVTITKGKRFVYYLKKCRSPLTFLSI